MNNLEIIRKIVMLIFAIGIVAGVITLFFIVYELTYCEPAHKIKLYVAAGAVVSSIIVNVIWVTLTENQYRK